MERQNGRFRWFDLRVVATVLITKFLVLLFGSQAFEIVKEMHLQSSLAALEIWTRWDAVHYLKIAETGYTGEGPDRFLIVFFPLYPILIHIASYLTGEFIVAAFLVTTIASIAMAILFRELVRLDHSERIAQLAVLFLFIFPTSYFLHIPYTESLFLALVIGCFLAARKRMWLTVAIAGALASMTRINGLILVPALAFEVWEEYRETGKINPAWAFLGLVPAGFGIYLLLNYVVAGDATMFLTYQREHFYRYVRVPWEGIYETYKMMYNPKAVDAQMNGVQEMLFIFLTLAATILGWFRLRNSYRVWMVANWLLFVSTSFVIGVPRYAITLFPLFILFALAARRSWSLNILITCWSLLFLALFSIQFVKGSWAF